MFNPPVLPSMTLDELREYRKSKEQKLSDLLRRAADKLQDYCERENGDLNDTLAMEIYKALGD